MDAFAVSICKGLTLKKNYIKGVTNAEELKQDSKIHEENDDKVKKKSKGENKSNSKNLNIREENNLSLRKHKSNTVVNVVHNLRNLRKEKTGEKLIEKLLRLENLLM